MCSEQNVSRNQRSVNYITFKTKYLTKYTNLLAYLCRLMPQNYHRNTFKVERPMFQIILWVYKPSTLDQRCVRFHIHTQISACTNRLTHAHSRISPPRISPTIAPIHNNVSYQPLRPTPLFSITARLFPCICFCSESPAHNCGLQDAVKLQLVIFCPLPQSQSQGPHYCCNSRQLNGSFRIMSR